ncbi:flagellar motor protein MotB [Pseudoroseicyclus aestuarii]|uniref:Chemotaxis protein MotB n=1 Tax=Pseudoroseicyclus aestuarii TaxID=1795041 RepID=A0A318STC0_9RHOB|nr:chemotaxis protein MotB [Pseudoroseicyclus aestuarii]
MGERPIIIKRKKVAGGDGHHGGAWKVAYADFVTAMMAFFLLMWLLNATTEQQRSGLADYFSPTISVSRTSGGGENVMNGDSMHTEMTEIADGTGSNSGVLGAVPFNPDRGDSGRTPTGIDGKAADDMEAAEIAALREVEEALLGFGGETFVSENAMRHVVTRLTDEGLIIELFALPDAPLFAGDTAEPMPVTEALVAMIAEVSGLVSNRVAVEAHLAAKPVMRVDPPLFPLSSERALRVREMLEDHGLDRERVRRVTGHADRSPVVGDASAPRNDRIEIILLRSDL